MPVKVGNSYVTEAALAFAQKSAAESVDKEKGKGTSGVLADLAEKFPKLKFTVGTRPFSGSGMRSVKSPRKSPLCHLTSGTSQPIHWPSGDAQCRM